MEAGRMTVVAIDGPSGAGKSTLARALATRLGLRHVDTGAYYRAAALAVLRAGVDPADATTTAKVVRSAGIARSGGRTRLDGADVEDDIRGPEVTAVVSDVAAIPEVRAHLVHLQRDEVGDDPAGAVVEGRDAGTVVVPDADLKVWLTASPAERALRRAAERGGDVAAEADALVRRDRRDAHAMARAHGVVEVDGTNATVEQLVERLVTLLRDRVAALAEGRA
jgi:cytidylate kinase